MKAGICMTISLTSEQERVLADAVRCGLARNPDDALAKAFDTLRERMPAHASKGVPDETVTAAVRRLANFGKRHKLSLGGMSIRELLDESRP
jgi:hypothetical protein